MARGWKMQNRDAIPVPIDVVCGSERWPQEHKTCCREREADGYAPVAKHIKYLLQQNLPR